jgi:hypothetical protein
MNRKLKIVIVLSASVILVYGLIQLGQDLANQNFNWTTENVLKYVLITIISIGLYSWTYERKKGKK